MPRLTSLSRSIAGKVAVVTGAASGMGRATAHLFADEGATVVVADRDGKGAELVAGEIVAAEGQASAWALDVADSNAVAAFAVAVVGRHGGADILVNNAGVSLPAPIAWDGYDEAWSTTIAVNLTAHARLVRAFLPHLRRSGEGR